jgi:hypothetical protein
MTRSGAAYLRRVRRRVLRGAAQFLASVLVIWLVAATLLAGSGYFHCSMEDETRLSSCCAEQRDDLPMGGPELRSTPCCEPRVMQSCSGAAPRATPSFPPS